MTFAKDQLLSSGNNDIDKTVKGFTDTGFEPKFCLSDDFSFSVRMLNPSTREVVIVSCRNVRSHPEEMKVLRNVRP